MAEPFKQDDIMALFDVSAEINTSAVVTIPPSIPAQEYNRVVRKFNELIGYVEHQETAIERLTRDFESQLNLIRRERDHALSDAARARQVLHDCEHHTAEVAKENQSLKLQAEQCIHSITQYHEETAKIFTQLKSLQEDRDHYIELWKRGLDENLHLIAENKRHTSHISQLNEIKQLQLAFINEQTRQIETMTAQLGIVVSERNTLTHGLYNEQVELRTALDQQIEDYQPSSNMLVAWRPQRTKSSIVSMLRYIIEIIKRV